MGKEPLNIYCDESTHLPNDRERYLVLGAVSCFVSEVQEVSRRMFEIREKHGISHDFEIKWTKVSPAKLSFYEELVDYFFDNDDLFFRVVVAPKSNLNHNAYGQTHDDWYYKMMFFLVRNLLKPDTPVHIYLDKKDTNGGVKSKKLREVLANSQYDFRRERIRRVQIVESHHVNLLQLADLLIGATNYTNRGLSGSPAKIELAKRVRQRSGYSLTESTLPSEAKFNVFIWSPRGSNHE